MAWYLSNSISKSPSLTAVIANYSKVCFLSGSSHAGILSNAHEQVTEILQVSSEKLP